MGQSSPPVVTNPSLKRKGLFAIQERDFLLTLSVIFSYD